MAGPIAANLEASSPRTYVWSGRARSPVKPVVPGGYSGLGGVPSRMASLCEVVGQGPCTVSKGAGNFQPRLFFGRRGAVHPTVGRMSGRRPTEPPPIPSRVTSTPQPSAKHQRIGSEASARAASCRGHVTNGFACVRVFLDL